VLESINLLGIAFAIGFLIALGLMKLVECKIGEDREIELNSEN